MKIYRHMMTNRDGHWWDEEKTIGWYIKKSKKRELWLGVVIFNGEKFQVCIKPTRSQTLKQTVQALEDKIFG